MTENFILHSTSKSELRILIAEVIRTELASLKPRQENESDNNRLLTRKEVAKLLGISLPTLHNWTKEGIVTAMRISSTVRYRYSDIQNALQRIDTIKYSRNNGRG